MFVKPLVLVREITSYLLLVTCYLLLFTYYFQKSRHSLKVRVKSEEVRCKN